MRHVQVQKFKKITTLYNYSICCFTLLDIHWFTQCSLPKKRVYIMSAFYKVKYPQYFKDVHTLHLVYMIMCNNYYYYNMYRCDVMRCDHIFNILIKKSFLHSHMSTKNVQE